MTVDPQDDCTFWYTNEYYATTGQFNWKTRIGDFQVPVLHLCHIPLPDSDEERLWDGHDQLVS